MITKIDPEVLAAGVTVLLAMLEAAREYHKHGEISLRAFAWDAKLTLFKVARANFFSVSKPDHESVVLDKDPGTVERELSEQGFAPDWPLSYKYEGELFNLRFYFYDQSRELPHRQIHVRGFDHENGVELLCHEEPTPEHHPDAHLASDDMEFENAVEWTKKRLENEVPVGYPSD